MELKMDFLLEECGNVDQDINNNHPIEFKEPNINRQQLGLLCNNNKTNELIGKRNFTCKLPIMFDPRPELTRHCNKITNKQIDHTNTEEFLENDLISCNPPLCPGKGDPKRYLVNIDVESSLKNIDYHTTNCKQNIHKLDYNCDDCRLSCYKDVLYKDYELPSSDINQCVKNYDFPLKGLPINDNIHFRDINDTGYDLSGHKICNLGFERIWNNPTKRSMMNQECPYKNK